MSYNFIEECIMRLLVVIVVGLFGLSLTSYAKAKTGGQYYTLECPKDSILKTLKTNDSRRLKVRCINKVNSKVKYPKCPLGYKLSKKEAFNGHDLCTGRLKKQTKKAFCSGSKYELMVKKNGADRCEARTPPKLKKP